ncbi:hypothetical protein BJX99DRAFT_13945 [Aspergillus californicus]
MSNEIRLATALRLFGSNPSSRAVKQLQESESYSLRLRTRNMAGTRSTWHDDDKSGNYDPDHGRKQTKRKRQAGDEENDDESAVGAKRSNVDSAFLASLPVFQDENAVNLDGLDTEAVGETLESVQDPAVEFSKGDNGQSPNLLESNELLQSVPEVKDIAPAFTQIRTISTFFAHPIKFDHITQPSEPCDFCSDFAYGILGLGKRTVKVIALSDGSYNEMNGGNSQGHKPSRMCVSCAQSRISIVNCSSHQIIPLDGLNPESFNFDAAYDSFTMKSGQRTAKNAWCSLCPTPAFFQCGAQTTRHGGSREGSSSATGCGLLLCETCRILMRAFKDNISRVVETNMEVDIEDGVRADVDYILPGNALHQYYSNTTNARRTGKDTFGCIGS